MQIFCIILLNKVEPEHSFNIQVHYIPMCLKANFQPCAKKVTRSSQQWRSQNAEKVAHITGGLLDQAVIFFNRVPFHNGYFSERKEFAPRGSEFFPLRAFPFGMENHFKGKIHTFFKCIYYRVYSMVGIIIHLMCVTSLQLACN